MDRFLTRLRVRDAAAAAGLLALALAVPSLANGFTYDDAWLIERNPIVHAPGGALELLKATFWPPTDGRGVLWRPVTLAGFALQWAAGGGSPAVFHLTTAVLGAVVAGLAAAVTGSLFGSVVALVAGLLFAVHPVHVEVTATAVGQAELIAAGCYVGVVWAAWRASERAGRPPARWLALAALFTALGLGAKEHVITAPAAILLVWWWRCGRDARAPREVARAQAPLLLAVLVMALGYLIARRAVLGAAAEAGGVATGLDPHSALQRATVMLPLSLRWLELLFFPLRLSADYSPRHVIPDPTFGPVHAAAIATWVLVAAAAWRARRVAPAVAFGAGLFAVTVCIVSNVPVPLEVLLAERLLYLPSLGWAMAVGGVVHAATRRPAATRPAAAAFALAAVLLAVRSALRVPVWRSNASLFAQMAREAPDSYRAHWWLGARAFAAGDSIAGERELRAAIRLNPDHPQPLEDLGWVYAASGRYAPAIPLLDGAVQLDSNRVGTALLLASALSRVGRPGDATRVLDAMERLHGGGPALQVVRADVLRRAGEFAKALAAAQRGVALDSLNWRLRLLAAETAWLAGECRQAEDLLAGARRVGGDAARGPADSLRERIANRKPPCK
jgi:hypothetical protein